MKVRNLFETAFLPRVNPKQERDSFSGQQDQQKKRRNNEDSQEEEAFNESDILHAIDAFGSDADAVANGLTATRLGDGPGLRVVLKDQAGTVIRQLTGEEFLKLREAVTGDSASRGKILDQKL